MEVNISAIADEIFKRTVETRRDFHKHPEVAWTEFRTTSIIADRLRESGFQVLLGEDILNKNERLAVPGKEHIEECRQRAIEEGANPETVEIIRDGITGVVGILKNGEGPTVGVRVDIDALEVKESEDGGHKPFKEGFSSIHDGLSHACGHDGHAAIGLAIAEVFSRIKNEFSGTLKLIFQPGEEGMRGARPMVIKGVVDDVDYLLGLHIGLKADRSGKLIAGAYDFLATTKMDVFFRGQSAHAGLTPQNGKNALLAGAAAATHLHAISRHGEGASRINVGTLNAGTGRNVIPDRAVMKIETRGVNTDINSYMESEARRVIEGAALMNDVTVEIKVVGSSKSGKSDPEMISEVKKASGEVKEVTEVLDEASFGACEDFTYMMEKVQSNGGKATFIMVGADLASDHHSPLFDYDEAVLKTGTKIASQTIFNILKK